MYIRERELNCLHFNLVFSNKLIEKCSSVELRLFQSLEFNVKCSVILHKLEKFHIEFYFIINWFRFINKNIIKVMYLFINI